MLPQAPFLVIGLLSAPHRPAAPTLRLCSVSLANSGRQERGAAARKRLSGSFVDAPDEYEEPLKSAARAEWEAAADAAMRWLLGVFTVGGGGPEERGGGSAEQQVAAARWPASLLRLLPPPPSPCHPGPSSSPQADLALRVLRVSAAVLL